MQKNFPTPVTLALLLAQRRRPGRLTPLRDVPPAQKRSGQQKTDPSVDKPMNIHRSECAELSRNLNNDFLSSFAPVQKQGLCNGLKHT